jgi:hypothetical protein
VNIWHLDTAARGGQPSALSTVHSVSDDHHALKLVPFVDVTDARNTRDQRGEPADALGRQACPWAPFAIS